MACELSTELTNLFPVDVVNIILPYVDNSVITLFEARLARQASLLIYVVYFFLSKLALSLIMALASLEEG